MKRLATGSAIVLAALVGSASVAAKEKEKDKVAQGSPLVTAIDRCRQIAEPMQRLTCYDNAAGALVKATTSGEVSVVDRSEVRRVRRSLFGFTMPRLPFFSGDTTAGEVQNKLESTVTTVRPLANGYFRITIAEDGAVWETSETNVSFDPPRPGQKIEILRGPLGSYFLRINGQVGVRGRRVG